MLLFVLDLFFNIYKVLPFFPLRRHLDRVILYLMTLHRHPLLRRMGHDLLEVVLVDIIEHVEEVLAIGELIIWKFVR